jgi:hypothetical protein
VGGVDPWGLKITVTYADWMNDRQRKRADQDLRTASDYLSRCGSFRHAWGVLERSRTEYTIRIEYGLQDNRYTSGLHTIHWDPQASLCLTNGGSQTPALSLFHELAHAAFDDLHHDDYANLLATPTGNDYHNAEEKRVIQCLETPAAWKLGQPTRCDHLGGYQSVGGPTCRVKPL